MPVSVDLPYDDEEEDDDEGEGESDDGMGEEDDSVVMAMMKMADAPEASHPERVDNNEGVGGDDEGSSSSSSRAVSDSSWESGEDDEDDEDEDDDDYEGQHDVEDESERGDADDEERGCRGWSASESESYSTESASCSTSSSSSASTAAAASSAEASHGSRKGRSGSCCPRKRCLWQVVVLVIIVAIPLGLVYRFYRSRHPLNAEAATRKAVTYPPFLSSSPTPSPTSYAPTSLDPTSPGDGNSTSNNDDNQNNNTTMLCNGLASLCSTPAHQVLFATLHNGHAAYDSGFTIFPNHDRSLEDALEAGFRGINVDVGRCDNVIRLTHAYCFLGTRDPVQVFTYLDSWLDENPHEVLLMPVQVDNEAGGPVTLEEVWDVLLESGNFVDKLYVHNLSSSSSSGPSSEYPTLQELIERNRRVLFFIYNGEQSCADLKRERDAFASTTNTSTSATATFAGFLCPDGMYDWFGPDGAAAETEYDFATLEAIEDPSNSCRVTRGSANDAPFFGVNVFLSLPTPETSTYLNGADFLGPHLDECARLNNRTTVSAVMVDFWDRGDVLEVVRERNSRL